MNNTKSISFLLQFVYKDIKLLERAVENVTCELVSLKKCVFFPDQFSLRRDFYVLRQEKEKSAIFQTLQLFQMGKLCSFAYLTIFGYIVLTL